MVSTMEDNPHIAMVSDGLISNNVAEPTKLPNTRNKALEKLKVLKTDKLLGPNGLHTRV